MLMKSNNFIGVCFGVLCWFFILACSVNHSATMPNAQGADAVKVVDGRTTRALDCTKPGEYSFLVVENRHRSVNGEPVTPKDVNIVIGDEVIARIELPRVDSEAKNFSLNSVAKTKVGFEVKVDWGGGLNHYEIQYNFRCKNNNFYLYKVRRDSFSTKNPDSGNFLDIKRTKIIRIDPILPIERFVMTDYLHD